MWTMLLAAAAATACPSFPGADQLWAKPATRWVIVGEVHGTREIAAAFADVVCAATRTKRPIAVALEYPDDEQAILDLFLTSDGSQAAQRKLTASDFWTSKIQDGRSSDAMLSLLQRLRDMKQAQQIVGVTAFQPTAASHDQTVYNAMMADRLRDVALPDNGLILTLAGNIHAMKTTLTRGTMTIVPAAADLPPDRTVSVDARGNGGMAWDCENDGCGPHRAGLDRAEKRGIVMGDERGRPPGTFDGVLELGVRTNAASPALKPPP